jgi:platelet-activating factor acetylhydrolase
MSAPTTLPAPAADAAPVDLPPAANATEAAIMSAHQTAAAVGTPEAINSPDPTPSAPKLHEIARRSPFGALLSRTLPNYTGEFDVGVFDIEVPVPRQSFGTFTHKSMPDKAAGLILDTVLYSVFYPCEPQKSPKPVVWFPA